MLLNHICLHVNMFCGDLYFAKLNTEAVLNGYQFKVILFIFYPSLRSKH